MCLRFDPWNDWLELTSLVSSNTGFENDGAIFLVVPDDQLAKLVAVAKTQIESERRHPRLNVSELSRLPNRKADACNNVRWHLGRGNDTKPVCDVESGHAAFRDRRHLRQHPVSLLGRNGQRLHLALRDERHDCNGRCPDERILS